MNNMNEMGIPAGLDIPKFEIPYDIVTLPSESKLYREIPSKIELEYIIGVDQDLLSSPSIFSSGDGVNILLKRKLRNKTIDIQKLLPGDKNALLVNLRIGSYGAEYSTILKDPSTGKSFTANIDLSNLEVKGVGDEPDEKGEFKFELPKSKKVVKYRLLNSGEEDEVYENAENRAKLTGSNVIPIVTDRLKAQVMELDGDRNKTFISQSIDHMLGVDINALRKRIREIEPGIDLFPKVKAPSGAECTAYIPMSLEFFWID